MSKTIDIADPVSLENSLDFKGPSRTYGYDYDGRLRATYRYSATGAKLSSAVAETLYTSPTATRYYIGPMEFMQTASDTEPRLERINLPWGYIDASGQPYRYIADHQGNIRAVIDRNGAIEQTTDYYSYGLPMATSTGAGVNPYKYAGKELETRKGLNFHDFEARMLFNDHTLFNRPDPQAAEFAWHSPYIYCASNPINLVDKNGMREWPVDETYNGGQRSHLNNYLEPRKTHLHQGIDINIGAGSDDLGAPVYATHDGIVESVATVKDGTNVGGNRVKIKSSDGNVATYYMHLNTIDDNIKVGSTVVEGQNIGTIGKSGSEYTKKGFSPHLHYEVFYKGERVNPALNSNHLVNPQEMIRQDNKTYTGRNLPMVTVTGTQNIIPQKIAIPAPKLEEFDISTLR